MRRTTYMAEIPNTPELNDKCKKCGKLLRQSGEKLKLASLGSKYITWDWFCKDCAYKIAEFIGVKVSSNLEQKNQDEEK